MTCIYCKAPLTPDTHRAHVWPRAMGGRLASRRICCDACNNAIGTAENCLREALSRSFASVGATDDEGNQIEVTIEHEGRRFILGGGNAILRVGGARFSRETRQVSVPLPAGFENQALAREFHKHARSAEAAATFTLEPDDDAPVLPVGPTRSDYDLKVGRPVEHKRVFIKMALELLAHHRHELAVRGELSAARRFARHGSGTFLGNVDTRSEGSGLLTGASLPEVYNAIEVWSSGAVVFFRAVFLRSIVFTGTLTPETQWTGDPFRAAYAFDARHPGDKIVDCLEPVAGPNKSIWFPRMIEETVDGVLTDFLAMSLRTAQAAPKVEQEGPPDLERLRRAVIARLATLPPKRW